jgi:hypothetical protein
MRKGHQTMPEIVNVDELIPLESWEESDICDTDYELRNTHSTSNIRAAYQDQQESDDLNDF